MTIPRSYAAAALEREVADLAAMTDGRKVGAHSAAVRVGSLVGAGALPYEDAAARLLDAAVTNGTPEPIARGAIRRGLRYGEAHPREALSPRPNPEPRDASQRRSDPVRAFPPSDEVAALWRSCVPVADDADVAAWLESRGLDVGSVELEAEVRGLPRTLPMPNWARRGGRVWTASGHRALFAVRDATGGLASLRARAVVPVADGDLKTLVPAGFGVVGAVLADHLGRRLLAGERPESWDGVVVVVEGEPDFLSFATNRSDAAETTYAVFGVASGSWAPAIGARIPSDATVAIWTDLDNAGDKYAATIAQTLPHGVHVRRATRGNP